MEGYMRTVNVFCHYLCFCCCLNQHSQSLHTDSQTARKNAVCLPQLTSCEAVIAESDVNTVSSLTLCSSSNSTQAISPGNLRLSIKWMLNSFSLVKCSSLFFSVFLNLVVQVQDVFKDVCTCFLSCYFCVVLSHHCKFCYLNTKYYSWIKKG